MYILWEVTESVASFFVWLLAGFTGGESVVRINGQDCEKAGISVAEYLETENYNVKHIVVEYNLEIIPKEQYAKTILKDGDEVEIVSFMGGGC